MGKRNPDSNSILQAILDSIDSGYGNMTLDQFATKLSNDAKLRKAMQEKWNAHAYPEKAVTWAQISKEQHLQLLSSDAFKLLGFLGTFCHQNGMIQAKRSDLVIATGIKRTALIGALAELTRCGAIRVEIQAVRHAAPVYSVNPALLNKGTRRKTDIAAFTSKLTIKPEEYLLNRSLDLLAHVETIYSDDAPTYNRLSLIIPEPERKKGPAVATTADPGSDKSVNPRPHHRTRAQKPSSAEQMSIYDWLGEVDS